MKTELIRCTKCNRHNWHENEKCTWCLRTLPKHQETWRKLNIAIAIVCVLSIASIVNWAVML